MDHKCENFFRVGMPCPRHVAEKKKKRRREPVEDEVPETWLDSLAEAVRKGAETDLRRSMEAAGDMGLEDLWPVVWADALRNVRRVGEKGRTAPAVTERKLASVMTRTVPYRVRGGKGGRIPYWTRYGMIRSLNRRREVLNASLAPVTYPPFG